MELSELEALVETLRKLGVTEYTNGTLTLKLGPVVAAPAVTVSSETTSESPISDELLFWSTN